MSTLRLSFYSTIAVFAITTFHHVYGAVFYHTPWREHVVVLGGLVLLLAFLCGELYARHHKKAVLVIYLVLTLGFFGLAIGIFEGFYNHLLRDVLYLVGMPMQTWRRLYPAPTYEIPNNLVFEVTGILQFLVALIQIRFLLQLIKTQS